MSTHPDATNALRVVRGSLWVGPVCYERLFGGAQTVALLHDPDTQRLWVVPLHSGRGGGFVLKIARPTGERAASIGGFLRDHRLSDNGEWWFEPRWDAQRQGLVMDVAALAETKEHQL